MSASRVGKLSTVAQIAVIGSSQEKLPSAARTMGAFLRRVRYADEAVCANVERELNVEAAKRAA